MKKILTILAVCLLAGISRAQINFINLTSLATNLTTSSAYISIPGVCTNYQYTVVNSNNIVIGDAIPSAFGKVNSDFAYVSNELALLAQLPNQINTNLTAGLMALSNTVVNVSNTVASATNVLATVTNALGVFLATGAMRFDGGLITSDGSGDAGFGRVATTNLFTARLAADVSDPPSSYGFQFLSAATGHVLYRAHNYESTYEFPAEDYYTWGGNFFSWSFIDGPTATRWGYLNVYENSGQCFFDYEGDSGYPLAVQYDGLLTANQVGVNNGSPAYTLDVGGDINFSGDLWYAGSAIFQPDSLGNGGTTLMLNASDTGTPMYIHVDSSGTITATSSP